MKRKLKLWWAHVRLFFYLWGWLGFYGGGMWRGEVGFEFYNENKRCILIGSMKRIPFKNSKYGYTQYEDRIIRVFWQDGPIVLEKEHDGKERILRGVDLSSNQTDTVVDS